MPAPTRTPRASWVEEGLRALGVGGPDAVRIEKLAQTLGVTKGGFYWHFDVRRALLEEMLDAGERLMIDEVIERVEAAGGEPRAKLGRLSRLASSGGELMKIELAIREWATAGPAGRPAPQARRQPASGVHAFAFRRLLPRRGRRRGPVHAAPLALGRQPPHRGRPRHAQPRGRARRTLRWLEA